MARQLTNGIERGFDTARDLGQAGAIHARRLVGILTTMPRRLAAEITELVLDCRDVLSTGLQTPIEEFDVQPASCSVDLGSASRRGGSGPAPRR